MAQMKEQIKDPEKIQLGDEESQPIRCTVQNTGNQDAHRNGWVWSKNRRRSKGYAKSWEIKENVQRTNSNRKETRTQINDLVKEEINIQAEQNEETRIQKNEESFRILWGNFECSKFWIIGVPGGEEEEQETENLSENIMKENLPNLAKEIDFQGVQ